MALQPDRRPAAEVRSPGVGHVADLLHRADAELVAAQFSSEAWEQFSHAHLAAVRAGAAVVAARGRPGGRRAPRTVWDMLGAVAPELSRWSAYFADAASLRSAVDAGRFDSVTAERAEQAVCAAEDFVDAVRLTIEAETVPSGMARDAAAARAS